MSFEFNPSRELRVKLPERLYERAVQSHLRASTKTRAKRQPWSPKEVIDVCELYISGWKAREIERYMPNRKQGAYPKKWQDVFKEERAYAKYLNEQNRLNNILGRDMEHYNYQETDTQENE